MEKKEAYKAQVEANLHEASAKIEQLKAKAEVAEATLKLKYQEQVKTLEEKKELMRVKLNILLDSGEEAWENFTDEIESTWNDVKGLIQKLRSTDGK